ncbi:hypothetical protein, conserved [Plasmodium gonderi]|uniref:Fam-a protein n=1 Tax=Plasmodium gonderi TaxID=77519 RepID=A0A1Y1JF12_PLAGO|nr:hypothetical protein, conserved [Plasmodium gonderi]GAW81121.1 hypothetical protein, conserved [Plasmodium gonderi]
MKKSLIALSLCVKLLAYTLFFPCHKVETKNMNVELDGKVYTVLYERKKVKFSDLDPLNIMFHSNHVKHSGNSLIRYLIKMTSKKLNKMIYVVKRVDITYDKPLTYDDEYKIIGGITSYGKTSLKVILFGTSSASKNGNTNMDVKNILRNGAFAYEDKLSSKHNSEVIEKRKQNKKITKVEKDIFSYLDKRKENNEDIIIKLSRDEIKDIASQKKCQTYFTIHYTLVQINEDGAKLPIKEKYKNLFPPIENEKLKQLVSVFC